MSERSIGKSEDLEPEAPEIYGLLRPHDYDLLYFLFEPAVKPLIEAVHLANTRGQPSFNEIVKNIEDKLNALS
ncbi:hypothetical protein [Pluralibacter sp.]|uniref:hypothetical protein n=1 Tax=Pluralibacter sp. TaxID=1920032 RepID=UPI0025FBE787|nr:hypothetical protein [Pluralibacter sp.]